MVKANISGRRIDLKTLLFPVYVVISIVLGITMGTYFSGLRGTVSEFGIPFGLFFMIYPAMTRIHLSELGKSLRNVRSIGLMLLLNYAIAPFLVAGLAYLFFGIVYAHYGLLSHSISSQVLVGIILLGVAPCIAMVMVWTDLAKGNLSLGVSFVAWNAIIQVVTTPFLVYLLAGASLFISPFLILESVLLYLASPLLAGIATREVLKRKSYFSRTLNFLGRVQTMALLFTIVVIFWSEGYGIVDHISLIWMVGVVMLTFYFLLFHVGYFSARKMKYDYADSTSIGFTVSARDFEVSIAIAVAVFSADPYVGITTAIGPLLEIPLMLMLVWLQLRRKATLGFTTIKSEGDAV